MNANVRTVAMGLGWFSLALGIAELTAPRAVGRATGVGERTGLLRMYGLRELAAGVGILMSGAGGLGPWLWSRVAGDAVDLATVVPALRTPRGRARAAAAVAAVAGVTAVDAYCARRLSSAPGRGG